MGKGKTVPRDGKGRTNKANNPPSIRPFRETLLKIIKDKREQEENRESILEKFKKLRPKPKEDTSGS